VTQTQSAAIVRQTLTNALAIIEAHETELGKLDAAAGDGDHGATMVRGLKAAVATLDAGDAPDAGALLSRAGMAFSNAAGGASGVLYGMFLATVGRQLGDGPYDTQTVAAALQAGQDVVARLGKAQPGDKTMLDALAPFVEALRAAGDLPLAEAWQNSLPAAEAGAAATADMVARRGRSSKLGERSLGHRDPGAVSMTYLLQAAGDALMDLE
jgi:dihydroxyacetone kinase phosphoprotein-dependent L subunit